MGEVIYLVNLVSGNSMGSSIQTSEIDNGAVTFAKLGNDVLRFEKLETLNFSNENSKTSSTLKAYNLYFICVRASMNMSGNLLLSVNGVSSAVYDSKRINNVTIETSIGDTSWTLSSGSSTRRILGTFFLDGKSPNVSSAEIQIINTMGGELAGFNLINGHTQIGQNTQVENITISANGVVNITGDVDVFGVARI